MTVNLFLEHPKAKFWNKELNKVDINTIKANCSKKFWFTCDTCQHDIIVQINKLVKYNNWCGYCTKGNAKLCDNDECESCLKRSFASHPMAKYWSSKNELTPRKVFPNNTQKYYFNCPCGHEIYKLLNTIKKDRLGCMYCVKGTQYLCDDTNCNNCFEKSFASYPLAKYWSKDNQKTARQVTKGSKSKYIFDCHCGHKFEVQLYCISLNNRGCPYCSNKKLCDNENCKKCFDLSFASYKDVGHFSSKNTVKPRNIFKGTEIKCIFDCQKCNKEYETTVKSFTNMGSRCPHCCNKTEGKLFDNLNIHYKNIVRQAKYSWCRIGKNNSYLPFDFAIEEYKIIIELDGRQHFKQVRNWIPPDKQQEQDKLKMSLANENGYSVIRILQEDVFSDKYKWLEELKNTIEKIKVEGKVQNIFLCKNNEYACYQC